MQSAFETPVITRFRYVKLSTTPCLTLTSLQAGYCEFMDELSVMIGAKPDPLRYLHTDPRLCYRLLLGPMLPYSYRLAGPHPWQGARTAILDVGKRMAKPLGGREQLCGSCGSWISVVIVFLLAVMLLIFLA